MKNTIATKENKRVLIHIFNEQLIALFHRSDADKISFTKSRIIIAATANMLYSDCPVLVIMETTLHEDAADVDTTVLAAMLVSIYSKP